MLSDISPCDINPPYGRGHGETFVDRDGVRDTVAGVEDDTSGSARGVEGENSLYAWEEGGYVEGFKEEFGRLYRDLYAG